jgi:hypothetical protein
VIFTFSHHTRCAIYQLWIDARSLWPRDRYVELVPRYWPSPALGSIATSRNSVYDEI